MIGEGISWFITLLKTEYFITFLPKVVWLNFGAISLVVVGLMVEKNYTSRPSLFANTMALNLFFSQLPLEGTINPMLSTALTVYLNIGVGVGVLSILSYFFKKKLPTAFYTIFGILYGSVTAGGLILLGNLI